MGGEGELYNRYQNENRGGSVCGMRLETKAFYFTTANNKEQEMTDNYYLVSWFSVNDCLPSEGGAYLVHYGNGCISVTEFMTFADGRTKWYDAGDEIGGITHWMPIPPAPQPN